MGARNAAGDHRSQVPQVRGSLVTRHRLLDVLQTWHSQARNVTTVCAQAGAGKTTLLADWCCRQREAGAEIAWLTILSDDNDPFVLWSHLAASCQSAIGDLTAGPIAIDTPRSYRASFAVAVEAHPAPLWLVLDDVHEITDPAALTELSWLLLNLPPNLHLMLACRHDPPLPLPRLVLDGSAGEIRADDLAFDRDETAALLAHHDVELDDDDLSVLMTRTEGWAAALKLAALQLADQDDRTKFLAAFAGDVQPVADYLVTEIFSRMDSETADVLLAASVPNRPSVELACELSGRPDAGAVLEYLTGHNALVYAAGTGTYRMHSLLRSYLLAELRRRDTNAIRGLHLQAAEWFDGQGDYASALHHRTAARDWRAVAETVAAHGVDLVLSGDADHVTTAVMAVPSSVDLPPSVHLVAALAELDRHDSVRALEHLNRIGDFAAPPDQPELQALHVAARLGIARLTAADSSPGGRSTVREASETAVESACTTTTNAGLLARVNRGMLRCALGRHDLARTDLSACLPIAEARGYSSVARACLAHLAWSYLATGDTVAAGEHADKAIELAAARGHVPSATVAPGYLVRAWIDWQSLRPEASERLIMAESLLVRAPEPHVTATLRMVSALIGAETSRRRSPGDVVHRATRHSVEAAAGPAALASACFLTELGLALDSGDDTWAAQIVGTAARALPESADIAVMNAMIAARHHHDDQVGELLREFLTALDSTLDAEESRPAGMTSHTRSTAIRWHSAAAAIIANLLDAHLAIVQDQPVRAHRRLSSALDLAASNAAARHLLAASDDVRALMNRSRGRFGTNDDLVDLVLSAVVTGSRAEAQVIDSLTERELEVLRELPSMLSVPEIAEQHVVSVNTLKTHLKAIYRKLEVGSRREAVERARDLGLL